MAKNRMVSLARTAEERMGTPYPLVGGDDYAPGLCLTLTDSELQKLDLADDCEPGDLVHMMVMVQVKSVNKTESGCRIEGQIIGACCVENESTETPDEAEADEGEE